jgi:para-aminobenzoate synthetase/4-amino-4-deoxychorismate lyase
MPDSCFALLDDCSADAGQASSRLYTGHVKTLSCLAQADLPRLFVDMNDALRQGGHALLLMDYELARTSHADEVARRDAPAPLAQILIFTHCEKLAAHQVTQWLAQHAASETAGIRELRANVSRAEFCDNVARIKQYLAAGDAYQVNFTYRLRFSTYGSLFALYCRLRARQPVPYGALIGLPDGGALLSLSPELMLRHHNGVLSTQPMKGTAAALPGNAEKLSQDAKNRSENLMIVDLLRNDLSQVAQLGTVSVPKLFEVKPHGEVLQMTSTVQAALRADASLADIINALFPCGSVTGAPKRRAMEIIEELEPEARGIYTGALGWFEAPAPGRAVGDFCLSVPIRSLQLQAPQADGQRLGVMGVGAGIVYESQPEDEYAECQLKAKFLTGLRPEFNLIETMYGQPGSGIRHLDLHLERLARSANYFGFTLDEDALRMQLKQASAALAGSAPHRIRLELQPDGACAISAAPLEGMPVTFTVMLAEAPVDRHDLFLRHKTTRRQRYDAALKQAQALGAFDMLFFNAEDELSEGARSNVFVQLDGAWLTPPLSAGILPGIMRRVLLQDAGLNARERRITRSELLRADQIVLCNALRGAVSATLVQSALVEPAL